MRTSALRLSVVYAASFAAAIVALVFVIYVLTTRFIDAEVDTVIERDAMGLLEAYGRDGTRGILNELDLRERTFSRINAVYLLTDADGFVIAGNLPAWPVMRGHEGRWVEFEIELREAGRETGRPVRAMVLEPGPGLRLLVGTDLSDRRDLGPAVCRGRRHRHAAGHAHRARHRLPPEPAHTGPGRGREPHLQGDRRRQPCSAGCRLPATTTSSIPWPSR